jgi:hypothetical protein
MPRRNVSLMTSGEVLTISLFDIESFFGCCTVRGAAGNKWKGVHGLLLMKYD